MSIQVFTLLSAQLLRHTAAWFAFTVISTGFYTECDIYYIYILHLWWKSFLSHSETQPQVFLHHIFRNHRLPCSCGCWGAWWYGDSVLWQQHKQSRTKTDLDEDSSGWKPWTSTVVHWWVLWAYTRLLQGQYSEFETALQPKWRWVQSALSEIQYTWLYRSSTQRSIGQLDHML